MSKQELQAKAFSEVASFANQPFKKKVSFGQKSEWFRLISPNLNYRKVKGYCNTNTLAALLAGYTNVIANNLEIIKFELAYLSVFKLGLSIAENAPPCYWITKDLLLALTATDLPKHWIDIKPFIPYGFFFLPPLIKSPKGQFVEWIYFDFFSPHIVRENIKVNNFELDHGECDRPEINWICGVVGEIYGNGILSLQADKDGLPEWNKNYRDNNDTANLILDFHENDTSSNRKEFYQLISSLILQLLLYQMVKIDIDSNDRKKTNNKSFTIKGKLPKNYPREPRWIGKDFELKTDSPGARNSTSVSVSRSSPRTHWRRGHWRNQPFGSRENPEYKNIWIEPILISS